MFDFLKKNDIEVKKQKIEPVEDFSNIEDLILYFKDKTGIDFFNKKEIVKNKLKIFCKKRDIYSFSQLLCNIEKNSELNQELIDHLTVNETYFFREIQQIEDMIEKAKILGYKIEILCAPSSSGEEPYTIAIMMLEAGFKPDDFHIVGIDISEKIISKATEAIYNERSLHRVNKHIKTEYFDKTNDRYALKEIVKNRVSFRRINIFDKSLTTLRKFDFIFSRNMMIYFDHKTKIAAKNILQSLLKRADETIFFGHADMVS